jgi:parvulin-like peptidyl-prolyl isomerase
MLHCRFVLAVALLAVAAPVQAQPQEPPPPAPVNNKPAADAVACTVNGQPILEMAVYRALESVKTPVSQRESVRKDVLKFFIDNVLVDQYLDSQKVTVDAKDVDVQVDKIKAELAGQNKKFEEVLQLLHLTEAEMRAQVLAGLRWEKFLSQYATEKALKDFFDGNKSTFDGSQVRAKHILLQVPSGDAKAAGEAKAAIAAMKKEILDKVAQGMAGAGQLEKLELEKKRAKLLEEAFAEKAKEKSACPSKAAGGELNWFPRVGGRVAEPFAQAAFALKVGEMSDAVVTEFGYHLILVMDTKPGIERKYDDIKDIVREIFAERMRDLVLQQMRPNAKIVINPAPQ